MTEKMIGAELIEAIIDALETPGTGHYSTAYC
jgi:hypothetical protein